MKRALCLLLAFAMLLPCFTMFASATEVPLVLEDPAVIEEAPAETTAAATEETAAPTEPVIVVPTSPTEETTEATLPEVTAEARTIHIVKEIEPGVYTSEEQVVTNEDGIMLADTNLPQLATPTDLKWGASYRWQYDSTGANYVAVSMPGAVSCKTATPSFGRFDMMIYKKNGEFVTGIGTGYGSVETLPANISDEILCKSDPESGTYYFTVTNIGDGVSYANSSTVKSTNWTYTKPTAKLGVCTSPKWNDSMIAYTKPLANAAYQGGIEIEYYYSPTKNAEPIFITSSWTYADDIIFQLSDWITQSNGNGYYYFKVRTLSSDITKCCNGEWSELSPALYFCGRPNLTVTNRADGIPLLSWTPVDNATSYKVYRSTTWDGTYTWLKTTPDTSMANLNAVLGQEYYYKVSAIVNGTETVCSLPQYCRCTIGVLTVTLSNNLTTGKNVIKWTKVAKADSYSVFWSTSEWDGYQHLTTTNNLTCTHTGAVAGTKYYYYVAANYNAVPSATSASMPKSRVCDLKRPTGLKVVNVAASGKNKISWNKVPGASKYQVYCSTTGKAGSFKLLYTTKNLYHIHTKAVAGQMYYYKVKAIHANLNANSAFTDAFKRTADLARPVVTLTSTAAGKPRLNWKAITGAAKYSVYISTTGKVGSFKWLCNTRNLYHIHKNAAAGTTYYYKVMAVHANTAANSAYSNVVTRAAK